MKNVRLFVFFVFCLGSGLAYAEPGKKEDIILSCPVVGHYLDGESISDKDKGEDERIVFSAGAINKDEITKVDILSDRKRFEANVISHSPDYLIIAYGNMIKEGLDTNLIFAGYMIDLQTRRFKRTLSFFPNGKGGSLEGQCKQVTSPQLP